MAQKVQLLIKNATYYANGVFLKGHILVNDGKIVGLMAELPEVEAAKTIDAKGKYVLPGMWIPMFTLGIPAVPTVRIFSPAAAQL